MGDRMSSLPSSVELDDHNPLDSNDSIYTRTLPASQPSIHPPTHSHPHNNKSSPPSFGLCWPCRPPRTQPGPGPGPGRRPRLSRPTHPAQSHQRAVQSHTTPDQQTHWPPRLLPSQDLRRPPRDHGSSPRRTDGPSRPTHWKATCLTQTWIQSPWTTQHRSSTNKRQSSTTSTRADP